MPLSRRGFITLAALAGGALWLKERGGPATPEAGKALAWGQYIDQSGNLTGERIAVIGVDGYNFVIEGGAKVSMEKLQITEGYPWKDVVTDPWFGYRLDNPGLMERVVLGGAGQVRIWGPFETLGEENSDFERAIDAAELTGLRPLVVLTPTEPVPDEVMKEKTRLLMTAHPDVVLEVLNEMDGPDRFWRSGDYNSAAHLIKVVIEEARRVNPLAPIVVGAMWSVNNQPNLLGALQKEGVDLNGVIWGVHAYQNKENVRERVVMLRRFLDQWGVNSGIWITELGVSNDWRNERVLLEMLEEAKNLGVVGVNVHELLDWQGFGVVKPDWSRVYPIFFEVAVWVRENG